MIACLKKTMVAILGYSAISAYSSEVYTNPIIAGGYPDPSICRVGDDFYLANSSFEYFPGLPIHHSRDLVNWTLIGHGLHRPEQASGAVNLVDVQSEGGIHAPSLRCRDGIFYLVTTNVYAPTEAGKSVQMVNFVLVANDPGGPWSDPHVIKDAPGIDPDLFFDDDGSVWYVGNHAPADAAYPGEGEIWLQRLDTDNWALTGKRHFLWRGALKRAIWAEGPHIYKHDGRYYLMVAEGGTSFDHAVTIAVSNKLTGPYIGNTRNPILTSRHLGYDNWVNSTGHADLVQLADGRWYMVALGIRNDEQRRSNMGRETHLIPVSWEREPYEWKAERYLWPVAAPASGRVERHWPLPFKGKLQGQGGSFVDDFDAPDLRLEWTHRRVPKPGSYSLTANPGHLRLFSQEAVPAHRGRSSLMGIKQTESDFRYQAKMAFVTDEIGTEAGISLFQKDDHYLNTTLKRGKTGYAVVVTLAERDSPRRELALIPVDGYSGEIEWQFVSDKGRYQLSWRLADSDQWSLIAELSATLLLSRYYTGAHLGLYSSSNGKPTRSHADFDWVRYQAMPRP